MQRIVQFELSQTYTSFKCKNCSPAELMELCWTMQCTHLFKPAQSTVQLTGIMDDDDDVKEAPTFTAVWERIH